MSYFIPIEFQKSFDKTQQNAFTINANYSVDDNPLGSYFGGYPFWHNDEPKPIDESGELMSLLVQINFSDLPKHPDLPESGILQFFTPSKDNYYGAVLDKVGPGKLISKFWDNPDIKKHMNWQKKSNQDNITPANGMHSIVFSKKQEFAGIDTIECCESMQKNPFEVLEDISINEKEESLFFDNIVKFTNSQGHKLLGYPYFLYNDPRQDSRYRLLLQIDTDISNNNDIIWGNNGLGYIFINNKDLKNKNFNNVWFYWDE